MRRPRRSGRPLYSRRFESSAVLPVVRYIRVVSNYPRRFERRSSSTFRNYVHRDFRRQKGAGPVPARNVPKYLECSNFTAVVSPCRRRIGRP